MESQKAVEDWLGALERFLRELDLERAQVD
jgi:hypothetical protein